MRAHLTKSSKAQIDNLQFVAALKRVAETAKAYGKSAGIQPGNRKMAAR